MLTELEHLRKMLIASNLEKRKRNPKGATLTEIYDELGIEKPLKKPKSFTNDWNKTKYDKDTHITWSVPTCVVGGKDAEVLSYDCGAVIYQGGMCRIWGEPKNLARLANSLGLDDELSLWIIAKLESVVSPNRLISSQGVINHFLFPDRPKVKVWNDTWKVFTY